MWKLRIGEGGGPSLMSVNNYVGREHWEFDPNAGTLEDKAEVERFREDFQRSRFKTKQSADLLMQMEVRFSHCISHFSSHFSSTLFLELK